MSDEQSSGIGGTDTVTFSFDPPVSFAEAGREGVVESAHVQRMVDLLVTHFSSPEQHSQADLCDVWNALISTVNILAHRKLTTNLTLEKGKTRIFGTNTSALEHFCSPDGREDINIRIGMINYAFVRMPAIASPGRFEYRFEKNTLRG